MAAALGAVAVVVLGSIAALTFEALEGGEVVELVTYTPQGRERRTRLWIADEGRWSWIEAATPERAFLRDIAREPHVDVWRGGLRLRMRAEVVPGAGGHARIRRLLRAKYGWADEWVGLFQDTSRSLAVRLSLLRPGRPGQRDRTGASSERVAPGSGPD